MNLVGKIFVVLIFVMSLVFMSFAVAVYGTHKNWKAAVENPLQGSPSGLKAQLEEVRQQRLALEKQRNQLRIDLDTAKKEKLNSLTKLQEYEKRRDEKLEEMTKQRSEWEQKDKQAIAALDSAQKDLARLTTEVQGLRTEIRDTQQERDKLFQEDVVLTDQINQTKGEIRNLEERRKQLADQVARLKLVLQAYAPGTNEFSPIDKLPPPLRGKVLAVNKDKMLEISLGTDDGLRVGHALEVFRASTYLGRIEILSITSDRAVAKVLPEFTKGQVQKGDDVATRFKNS